MDTKNSAVNTQYFQIFLRLRPSNLQSSISESRFLSIAPGTCHVYITPPAERNRTRAIEKYEFTKIFDERSKQIDVFEDSVLPLLQEAVHGRDAMLATLGVTGSGKTHTILGNKDQKGMIQMALEVLFSNVADHMVDFLKVDVAATDHSDATIMDIVQFQHRIGNAPDASSLKHVSMIQTAPKFPDVSDMKIETDHKSRYAILISMYELYNDRMFDLLDETPIVNPTARRKGLVFKKPSTQSSWDSSKEQKKVVSGLRKVYARNVSEALQILEHGQACRRASPTNSNLMSSRSHAFFQIEIKRFSLRGNEKESSSLQIVDLAGSERARNAQTAGQRLAEAGSINRSLMCLGQCLQLQTQTAEHSKSTAPWRQSKLTEILFSNTLSGVSRQKAAMIVTADAMGDLNATWQILRYSALAKEVTVPHAPIRQASGMSNSSTTTIESIMPDSDFIEGDFGKDALIARLISQLEETESQWHDAEERCLLIEQMVREEVVTEMDSRLEEVRREFREARDREEGWRQEYVDEKLDILKKGMDINDTPVDLLDRIAYLEEENHQLHAELMTIKRQILNRSPTKPPKVKNTPSPENKPLDFLDNKNLCDDFDRVCL